MKGMVLVTQFDAHISLYCPAFNPNVTPDGWSYFHFKCPCLHPCGTALSLLGMKSYI